MTPAGARRPSKLGGAGGAQQRPGLALGAAAGSWVTSQVVSGFIFVAILVTGDYSSALPERPGGHIGRAAGKLVAGEPLVDDGLPLLLRMFALVPGWLVLLGAVFVAGQVFGIGADRDWNMRGRPIDIGHGLLGGLVLQVPILIVVMFLLQLLFGDIAPSGRALALVDEASTAVDYLVLYAAVAIGAPVVEELFYRGVVQKNLVARWGPWVGIGLASVLFGIVHFSLVELVPLTVVGAVFGYLYHRSGRLAPAIVAHITFNAFTLSFLLASR